MADRIVIQCPSCSAKLAISDASKLGKKIKCSKCSEIFVAKAMSSATSKAAPAKKPVTKPKKSDDDEFNFDDMEMEDSSDSDGDESEEKATRSSRVSGKKSTTVKGKSKGKGKNDMADSFGPVGSDFLGRTRLEGTKALIALRRWYGTHREPPTDFAAMCREAGLTEPPRDYFSNGPLRMVTFQTETPIQDHPLWELNTPKSALAGETIIYSVGPDGVDDHAAKHYGPWGSSNPDLGGWLFRLEIPQSQIPTTTTPAASPISVSAAPSSAPNSPVVGVKSGE